MAKHSPVNNTPSPVKPEQIRLNKAKHRGQELSNPVCFAGSPELRPEFQDLNTSPTAPEPEDKALENDD